MFKCLRKASHLKSVLLNYNSKQTEINFGNAKEKRNRMLDEVNQFTGNIINIPCHVRQVFYKISVIYGREQTIPEKPFLNSILTNLTSDDKKCFPNYKIQRLDGLMWSCRDEFCTYFSSLECEVACKRLETQKDWIGLAQLCESKRDEWLETLNYNGHVTGISWLKVYSSGHVLTRIMELGANAYFRLKEYQIQVEILQSLISQNVFLMEHKGRWYDELIKISDLYLDKNYAKQICLEALCDDKVIARTYISYNFLGRRLSIINRAKKFFKKQDMLFDKNLEEINTDSFPQSTLLGMKYIE